MMSADTSSSCSASTDEDEKSCGTKKLETNAILVELKHSEDYRKLMTAQLATARYMSLHSLTPLNTFVLVRLTNFFTQATEENKLLRLKIFDLDEKLYASNREVVNSSLTI